MASLSVEYHTSPTTTPLQAYTLRIVVTDAVDMDKEVFMFQRGAGKPPTSDEDIQDSFVCIADPVDMDEVPKGAPDLANEMPYYRLSEVTLSFRSITELVETKQDIVNDLKDLIRALNQMPTRMELETYE